MKQITNNKIRKIITDNFINWLDFSDYPVKQPTTKKERIETLYNIFMNEMKWSVEKNGRYRTAKDWFQGLPTCSNHPFTNYDIITLLKTEEQTEDQNYKTIENYWNMLPAVFILLYEKTKCKKSIFFN